MYAFTDVGSTVPVPQRYTGGCPESTTDFEKDMISKEDEIPSILMKIALSEALNDGKHLTTDEVDKINRWSKKK